MFWHCLRVLFSPIHALSFKAADILSLLIYSDSMRFLFNFCHGYSTYRVTEIHFCKRWFQSRDIISLSNTPWLYIRESRHKDRWYRIKWGHTHLGQQCYFQQLFHPDSVVVSSLDDLFFPPACEVFWNSPPARLYYYHNTEISYYIMVQSEQRCDCSCADELWIYTHPLSGTEF